MSATEIAPRPLGATPDARGGPDRNPFPGPKPYRRGQADVFFGRQETVDELVSLVLSSGVVLLHSVSGAGKSSLLQAGLLPELEDLRVLALPMVRLGRIGDGRPALRAGGNPFLTLCQETVAAGLELGPDDVRAEGGLPELFRAARARAGDDLVLLVLDQFEEIFLDPALWAERDDFLREIRRATDGDDGVRVLLSMRSDYLAELLPHEDALPSRLVTRFAIESLREDAARAAITGAFAYTDVPISPDDVDRLLDQMLDLAVGRPDGTPVRGQYVNLIQLQILCRRLWQDAADSQSGEVSVGARRDVPDLEEMMRGFVDAALTDVVRATGADEGIVRRWLADRLITGNRRRDLLAVDATAGGLSPELLDGLERARLIQVEQRNRSRWAELTHDSMVSAVLGSNERWMEHRRRRRRWHTAFAAVAVLAVLAVIVLLRVQTDAYHDVLQRTGTLGTATTDIDFPVTAERPVVVADVSVYTTSAPEDSDTGPLVLSLREVSAKAPAATKEVASSGDGSTSILGRAKRAGTWRLSITPPPGLEPGRQFQVSIWSSRVQDLSPGAATTTIPADRLPVAVALPRDGLYRAAVDDAYALDVTGGRQVSGSPGQVVVAGGAGDLVLLESGSDVTIKALGVAAPLEPGESRAADVTWDKPFAAPLTLTAADLPAAVSAECDRTVSFSVAGRDGENAEPEEEPGRGSPPRGFRTGVLLIGPGLEHDVSILADSPDGTTARCEVTVSSAGIARVTGFGRTRLPPATGLLGSVAAIRLPTEAIVFAKAASPEDGAEVSGALRCGSAEIASWIGPELLGKVPANQPCVLTFHSSEEAALADVSIMEALK
jgi:hypothetical protein